MVRPVPRNRAGELVYPHCETARCTNTSTVIESRIDAIRDWRYKCPSHAQPGHWSGVWEQTALDGRLPIGVVLRTWPPKYRGGRI